LEGKKGKTALSKKKKVAPYSWGPRKREAHSAWTTISSRPKKGLNELLNMWGGGKGRENGGGEIKTNQGNHKLKGGNEKAYLVKPWIPFGVGNVGGAAEERKKERWRSRSGLSPLF